MIVSACLLGGVVLSVCAFLLQVPTHLAVAVFVIVSILVTLALATLASGR